MSVPRLGIIASLLAAFVAGILVGVFLIGNAGPPSPVGAADGARDSFIAATGRAVASRPASELASVSGEAPPPALSGDELIAQFWTTLTMADENARHAEWLRLMKSLGKDEAVKVRDLFQKMNKEGKRFTFEWNAFWPRWGEVDGAGALEYLRTHEYPTWRNTASAMLLRGWATADPAAARQWLKAHEDSPFYDGAMTGYLDGLGRQDLPRATQEALSQLTGNGHRMDQAMEVLAEQALQQRQLSGMVDWWKALPDDSTNTSARQEAVQHVWWRLQFADNDKAMAWLAEQASGPYRGESQILESAKKALAKDPAQALTWLAQLPPSPVNGTFTGLNEYLNDWAETDAAATEKWLRALPASAARDEAYATYGLYLQVQKSPASQRWLEAVDNKAILKVPRNITTTITIPNGNPIRTTRYITP